MSAVAMRRRFSSPLTSPRKRTCSTPCSLTHRATRGRSGPSPATLTVQIEPAPLREPHGLERLVHPFVGADPREEEHGERPAAATAGRDRGRVHGGERVVRHRRRRGVDGAPVPQRRSAARKPAARTMKASALKKDAAKARLRRPSMATARVVLPPADEDDHPGSAGPRRLHRQAVADERSGVQARVDDEHAALVRAQRAPDLDGVLGQPAPADGAPSSPRRLPTTRGERRGQAGRTRS